MTRNVNPSQLKDLINVILSDKITECEQKQLDAINNNKDEKSLYFQGAIEVMSELVKQVDAAVTEINSKNN